MSSLRDFPAYQRPPAEKIGKYKILGTLGRGGMGIVYKGLDPDIEREVAIKTIRIDTIAEGAQKEEMLARVVREAKAAGRLDHPNIITIYDVIHEADLTYIVMQYVDGHSLQNRMDSGVRFSPREVIDLLKPIAAALDFAHQNGIVHRDVKPANILIDKRGKLLLADFGVARLETSTMTGPGRTIGTFSYMSPEQVTGGMVDHRADIFALGVILYELLTGNKPFAGDNLSTIVYKIVNEEPPRVTEINHDLPAGYEDVIKMALAKNPEERYQSGRAMIAALEDPDKLAEATRAYGDGAGGQTQQPARQWRWLALAGGLLVFAALAGVGYKVVLQGRGGRSTAADSKALRPGDKAAADRLAEPLSPTAKVPPGEEKLARLKASFERRNFQETLDLAQEMLSENPADAVAKAYHEKARAAQIEERVKPLLERGVARFESGDFRSCVADMEEILKIDRENKSALDYMNRADRAISEKDISVMLEQFRAAEETKDPLALIACLGSESLASRETRQYKEWFNRYDGIASNLSDKSLAFVDRWNATLSFSQVLYGTDRRDRKKKMVYEGPRTWVLKKGGGVWKIVDIR